MSKYILGPIIAIWLVSTPFLASVPAKSGIVETATTGVAINSLLGEIKTLIDSSLSETNFLVWSAGVQARLTLERWQEVNSELLDQTFESLEAAQKDTFRGISDQLEHARRGSSEALEASQQIVELLNQTVQDAKFWDGQPAVFRYYPNIFIPGLKGPDIVVLRGVNLDLADPKLSISISDKYIELERVSLTKQEAQFKIDTDILEVSDTDILHIPALVTLQHREKKFFGLIEGDALTIRTEANFLMMPRYAARLTNITALRVETQRRYTGWKNREFAYSNSSHSRGCEVQVQNPGTDHFIGVDTIQVWNGRPHPKAGQRLGGGILRNIIIPQNATLPGQWGRGGSQRLASRTREGFAVRLCAKRWVDGFPPDSGPGNIHVIYRWKEYMDVDSQSEIPLGQDIAVTWSEDKLISANGKINGIRALIKLFTGENRIEIRERLNEKYYSIEINNSTGDILIKPHLPSDLRSLSGR